MSILQLFSELKMYDDSVVLFEPPALDYQIAETENYIGVALPDEYKEFVRKSNGLEFGSEYILRVGNDIRPQAYSINEVYDFEHNQSSNPMPHNLIPFSPDGYGNHYCFDINQRGVIVFWQHDYEYSDEDRPEIVYNSMEDMIQEVFIKWGNYNYDGSSKEVQ